MGLSVVAYAIYVILKGYLGAKVRMHDANVSRALRKFDAGEKNDPSWVRDQSESEIFWAVVQKFAARKGVPTVYLSFMMGNEHEFNDLRFIAGAIEREGASFTEQQTAIGELLVRQWNRQTDEVKLAFQS
ncbi:MAG: hypothetical protein ABF266_00140 [Celeribacter marinus]